MTITYHCKIFQYGVLLVLLLGLQQVQSGCQIPSGRRKLIMIDYATGNRLQSSAIIPTDAIVRFECRSKYYLVGDQVNVCESSGWEHDVPVCVKFCSKTEILEGYSTRATCYYGGQKVNCGNRIMPGTVAYIGCAPGYRRPRGATFVRNIKCTDNGRWAARKVECEQICGRVAPPITEFAQGGELVDTNQVPWHVGIFNNHSTHFQHTCGGTIISPLVVISAAHCFWDRANKNLYDVAYYLVLAGKSHTNYSTPEVDEQQRSIQDIFIAEGYEGRNTNYLDDVAVLLLTEHLIFSESVRPICLKFEDDVRKGIGSYVAGLFAGWGSDVNRVGSDELQSIAVETLSHDDCVTYSETNFADYELQHDKFCLPNTGGSTACRGDSGSGFVVRRKIVEASSEGREFYYLEGVISHTPFKAHCAKTGGIVVVTSVHNVKSIIANHVPWLLQENATVIPPVNLPDRGASNNSQSVYCKKSDILKGYSTIAICKYRDEDLDCDDSIVPGTIARISCANGYVRYNKTEFNGNIKCGRDGKWDVLRTPCVQECGRIATISPFIVGGEVISPSKAPWHVNLYRNEGEKYNYYCGGTIISPYVVISAAHCFWDTNRQRLYNPTDYQVLTGQSSSDYTYQTFQVEKYDVREVTISEDYQGVNTFFRGDISIVFLKTYITFSDIVRPVCLRSPSMTPRRFDNSSRSMFTILNGIDNPSRLGLRSVSTEIVAYNDCKPLTTQYNHYELQTDAICLVNKGRDLDCAGISGSGVVVEDGDGRYYLEGVISNSPTQQYCGSAKGIFVATNIQNYTQLVQKSIEKGELLDHVYLSDSRHSKPVQSNLTNPLFF